MNAKSYEILYDLIGDMQAKLNAYQSNMNKNNTKISEMQYYLQSLPGDEDSIYKIFSPRDGDAAKNEEIDKINQMISFIQAENERYHIKILELQFHIGKLEEIIENEKEPSEADQIFGGSKTMLLNVQEKERQQLIKEFEITTLQNLTYLMKEVDSTMVYIDQNPILAKMKLSSINKNIINTIKDVGNTLNNYGTLVLSDGLKLSIEKLLLRINEKNDYEITKDLEDVSCESNYKLITIFRVIQECLNNIVKHSDADKIYVKCKHEDDQLVVVVEDNGKGITTQNLMNNHFGISLMKERVELLKGKIEIDSEKNRGTKINIAIPCK